MKITAKHIIVFLALLFLSGFTVVCAQQDYSNTTVTNDTGKPMSVITIYDSNNEDLAKIYITGKEASFGANQRIVSGSGYIQALPNKYFSMVFKFRYKKRGEKDESVNMFQMEVKRVDWDNTGNTTHIAGIKHVVNDWFGNKMRIISDLKNPRLTNGILNLDIEKIGKISIDIRFGGHGIPIDPSFPAVCSKIVGDKVFVY